jgi:glycosyltransferase involved in cell wall biosynthesis
MRVIAVIPAYNEEKTISEAVKRAKREVSVVLVVDDGSIDKTPDLARWAGAIVMKNTKNRGCGYSKRRGILEAVKMGADIIITLDADLQHRPEDIPRFVGKIEEGYDFVIGRRNIKKYPLIKKIGNFGLNFLTNFLSGTRLQDTESGFKAFSRPAAKKLRLTAERYAIEAEIAYEVGRNKLKHTSIPIDSPRYRSGVTVMHGIRNFWFLVKRKLKSIRKN